MRVSARCRLPPEEYKRKLAAILSADVAGYSRLMADDNRVVVALVKVSVGSIAAMDCCADPSPVWEVELTETCES